MLEMIDERIACASKRTSVRVAIFASHLYVVCLCDGLLVHKSCEQYTDIALSLRDFWCHCASLLDQLYVPSESAAESSAASSGAKLFSTVDEMIICRGPGSFTSYRALCSFVLGVKAVHTKMRLAYLTLFDLLKIHYLAQGNSVNEQMIFAVGSEASHTSNGSCYVCYHANAHLDDNASDIICGRVKIDDYVYQTVSLQDSLFKDRVVVATSTLCIENAAAVDVYADFLDILEQATLSGNNQHTPLYLPLRPNAKF